MNSKSIKDNIFRKIGKSLTVSMEKWLPDAFIFAIILSIVVYIGGLSLGNSPLKMLELWYGSFWKFLGFTMQMCLVVATGHALATTKFFDGILIRLANFANTPTKSVVVVFSSSFIASLFNWGLGLVVGAIIAKKIVSRQRGNDFPLLTAAAYAGAMSSIFGFSIPAPLLVNTPGHSLESVIGLIPVSETIFSTRVLLINLGLFVLLNLVFVAMLPKRSEEIIDVKIDDVPLNPIGKDKTSFASRLETASWISYLIGVAGIIVIVDYFRRKGLDLNIDIVNFIFLIIGIVLHKNPANYIKAFAEGMKSCYGMALQFPFYAGIMGMMEGSGLITTVANWTNSFSTTKNFPFVAFLQSTVVNFFVPSAGGKWLIQGPVLVESGQALNVSNALTVIGYGYGDLATNLIQPFWALPVLGIANLKIKDIWGYCFVAFLVFLFVIFVGLYLF